MWIDLHSSAYPPIRGGHDGKYLFVGLDVHKKTIAVATVEGRASIHFQRAVCSVVLIAGIRSRGFIRR